MNEFLKAIMIGFSPVIFIMLLLLGATPSILLAKEYGFFDHTDWFKNESEKTYVSEDCHVIDCEKPSPTPKEIVWSEKDCLLCKPEQEIRMQCHNSCLQYESFTKETQPVLECEEWNLQPVCSNVKTTYPDFGESGGGSIDFEQISFYCNKWVTDLVCLKWRVN